MVQSGLEHCRFSIFRSTSFSTPALKRARRSPPAALRRGQIRRDPGPGGCLPKDEAGSFIADQEKSDVVHDLLAFLAERMLEMNKPKATGDPGTPGVRATWGVKVEDLTPKTELQGYYEHDYESLLAVFKKNRKKLDNRSCPPGAGRDASGRARGVDGQAGAATGEDREDGQADRRLRGFTGSRTGRSGSWKETSPYKQFHKQRIC